MFANVLHTGTLLAYNQNSDVLTQHFMSSETSQKYLVDSYYLVQSLLPLSDNMCTDMAWLALGIS